MSRLWRGAMLVVVGFTPAFGILFSLPEALTILECEGFLSRLKHYVFVLWVACQFLYNFVMAQCTDPGGTAHVLPTFASTGQFLLARERAAEGEADDVDADSVNWRQMGSQDPLMYAPSFCDPCKIWKPPRAHHCSMCGRCVLRMDHHCPFVGNCIGLKNHGHFVLMYVFALLGLLYSLGLCSIVAWYNRLSAVKHHHIPMSTPHMLIGLTGMMTNFAYQAFIYNSITIALQLCVTIIALVAVLSFGFPAVYYAVVGQTMLETMFPMKEYVQIGPHIYVPLGNGFYNRGCRQNVRDILGHGWRWRLLLPVRGAVDTQIAIAPRPSDSGIEALKERIAQVQREGVRREVRSTQELGINEGPDAKSSAAV